MGVNEAAEALAQILVTTNQRVIFAESCTAGLVSATLAHVPGISQYHCGSAVTYRSATKQEWLDISGADLEQFGAVSETVARQMAKAVLEKTPEADYSAAVTGHLGPDAPAGQDGVIFVGIAKTEHGETRIVEVSRHVLTKESRTSRQVEAASIVLRLLANIIADAGAIP